MTRKTTTIHTPEPYAICSVVHRRPVNFDERLAALREAGHDTSVLEADSIFLDFFMDSGMSALSEAQMSLFQRYSHSIIGAPYKELVAVMEELTGSTHVLPLVKGRAAENVLFWELLAKRGANKPVLIANSLFDTTRHNILHSGGLPIEASKFEVVGPFAEDDFKGDFNLNQVDSLLAQHGADVKAFVMTITSVAGGHAVSLDNLLAIQARAKERNIPIILDATRFAENAYLVREATPNLRTLSPRDVSRKFFDCADIIYLSAAKDALSPTGAVLVVRTGDLYRRIAERSLLLHGYAYTGGLPQMMLAVMAQGIREGIEEDYLKHRIGQSRAFADAIADGGAQTWAPAGGHAAFVQTKSIAPTVAYDAFPSQAFLAMLYLVGGIRGGMYYRGRAMAEYRRKIGAEKSGEGMPAQQEQQRDIEEYMALRLCLPRRKVTNAQAFFAAETIGLVTREIMALHPGMRELGPGDRGEIRMALRDEAAGGELERAARDLALRIGQ